MKLFRNHIRNDIKFLIDLSCVETDKTNLFEAFHKTILAISYGATDICIDYEKKRVYMNVTAEDSHGDFLERLDESHPTIICLNLVYENLDDFLKENISEDKMVLEEYYPALKAQFIKGKTSSKENPPYRVLMSS